MSDRLTVMACWFQARREFPDNRDKMRARYVELLRKQGHLIEGPREPLPCGWPSSSPLSDSKETQQP